MKRFLIALVIALSCYTCDNPSKTTKNTVSTGNMATKASKFAIVIHGGAGTILKKNMTPEKEEAYKLKLKEAIMVGYTILKNGGSSLDAVEQTIMVLEDSPLFNAGKGAVFTNTETNTLDASIMDGKTLNAGASAGTTTIKNPITLARRIMEQSQHVMLYGKGAETFASENGITTVEPSYFYTPQRFKALQRAKAKEKIELDHDDSSSAFYDATINNTKFGTVGCVALDQDGNLAGGTSTGGMTNKRYDRIGDSPIIGAGTYANNATCAVSSTGWGEYFIRALVAHDISALMEYKGISLKEAAKLVIKTKLKHLGGTGGIVAVDKNGSMVMEFNTAGMYRASISDKDELYIGIYE